MMQVIGLFCKYVCVIISPRQPLPHTLRFPFLSPSFLPFLLFKRFSKCLKFCLLFTFSPLFLQLLIVFCPYFQPSKHYLLPSRDNISMVFKIGSTVLQRTIYDPILRAILIPEYTYFHPQNLKIFHFLTLKLSK